MDYTALHDAIAQGLAQGLANAPAPPAPAPAPPPAPRPRNPSAEPERYDGNRATYATFRRSIDLFTASIVGDSSKILAAVSYMTTGDADSWAQSFVTQYLTDVMNGTYTWTRFTEDLDKHFKDPREAEHAREHLFKLTMGRQDAANFFLKFDELRIKANLTNPDYHDTLLVELLDRRLPPPLALVIQQEYSAQKQAHLDVITMLQSVGNLTAAQTQTQKDLVDVPISYGKYRELALKHDPTVTRFTHGVSNVGTSRNHPMPQPRSHATFTAPVPTVTVTNTASARDPNAMDVDRTRRPETRRCYKCQKTGHLARSCPENTSSLLRQLDSTGELDIEELRRFLDERDKKKQPMEEKDFPNLQ
jgi:hypothetical protein